MYQTVKAIIESNNQLKLLEPYSVEAGTEVLITILSHPKNETAAKEPNGKKLAEIMKKIADMGGLPIEDPVEWQKEIRKDRPLPGRE